MVFTYNDVRISFAARTLNIVQEYKDPEEWVENGEGYFTTGTGDSGGGYMVTDTVDGDERYTFLAMVASFMSYADEHGNTVYTAMGSYMETDQCRVIATKLTRPLIQWYYRFVIANT